MKKKERMEVGVVKEDSEGETERHSSIHWSSAKEAPIKWSHSSGNWSTPNAMWLVLSLGSFQA